MTTYLVDYEDTSHHGLKGYAKLDPEKDTVIVFVGAKYEASSIPVDTVMEMTPFGQRPGLLWKRSKKTAKNYLDIQLVSYLGYLIGDPSIEERDFVIVSKDQDFQAAVDFWSERRAQFKEVTIALRQTIAPESKVPPGRGPDGSRASRHESEDETPHSRRGDTEEGARCGEGLRPQAAPVRRRVRRSRPGHSSAGSACASRPKHGPTPQHRGLQRRQAVLREPEGSSVGA